MRAAPAETNLAERYNIEQVLARKITGLISPLAFACVPGMVFAARHKTISKHPVPTVPRVIRRALMLMECRRQLSTATVGGPALHPC